MSTAERIYWLRTMACVPLGWHANRDTGEYQYRRARWDWRYR